MTRRPLDRVRTIRGKLSLLVVGAVLVSAGVSVVGGDLGWPIVGRQAVAAAIGLAVMRAVAVGMTRPLREMAAAADAMARGGEVRKVETGSRDEVGQLAEAFNLMSDRVAESQRQQRDLVANAAHELRSPIAALSLMIEQAELEAVGHAGQPVPGDELATMATQVRRLSQLVDQLLSLSRLDAGSPLRRERVELGPLLDEVVDEARWQHPDADIAAERPPDDLAVDADPLLVRQMLANLTENALRHGAPPVRLAARPAGARVEVVITDCGPGIPSAERERVFERFTRLDRSRSAPGTGLGLAIVAGIAERHGASVRVEDHEPTGTRVVVDLPAASPDGA